MIVSYHYHSSDMSDANCIYIDVNVEANDDTITNGIQDKSVKILTFTTVYNA